MTIEAKIDTGILTLQELTKIIELNLAMAERLGCKLSSKVINGVLWGYVSRNGETKGREYTGKRMHLLLADMQVGFRGDLNIIQEYRKMWAAGTVPPREEDEEDREPYWYEKMGSGDLTPKVEEPLPDPGPQSYNLTNADLISRRCPSRWWHEENCEYFSVSGVRELYPNASFPPDKVLQLPILGVMMDTIKAENIMIATPSEIAERKRPKPVDDWGC